FEYDVYLNLSHDSGATWLPVDLRLDVSSAPGTTDALDPALAVSGSSVYATWRDGLNAIPSDIEFNRSLDGGATWLPADVRLDVGDPPHANFSRYPEPAASGGSVFVAWMDERDGLDDIYVNRSLDGGATWLPADRRLDLGSAKGSSSSGFPQIAALGSSVYVAYSDDRSNVALGFSD